MNLRSQIVGLDTLVPTVSDKEIYINFDNAASTPPLKSVLKAVNDFAPWYSSVHRGNGYKSRLSTENYEDARRTVGQFVGANPDEHVVIFGKNTTEAINKLSFRLNLKKKDIVVISNLEHHSNDLPWRARATVKRIRQSSEGGVDKEHFAELLRKYTGKIKLIAITGASNVTGHLPDIHWFARQAHEAGAQILVDCAQLAAHRPIDIKHLNDPAHLDYIAISAHKMYAPFGTGALIGRRDTFSRGAPEYQGGGTVNLVTPRTVDWTPPPDSEEAGSPNVIGAVALAQATKTLQDIGFKSIVDHEAELTKYALQKLSGVPGITIYGEQDPSRASDRSAVIPFTIHGMPSNLVAAVLGFEWGIGVRSGCFCAHPYVMSLLGLGSKGINLIRHAVLHQRRDLVPGLVRVSLGLYNTKEEIDKLVGALNSIARHEFGKYTLDRSTGEYTPENASKN